MQPWSRTDGPLLYAHRGASAELPENTLAAFRRALELGADVLELDLHSTRDGVFVVSHDPSGERTCGVSRRLADCAWAEVSAWDAGFGYVNADGLRPHAGGGVRLVRFDDLLEQLPDVAFNVDVKEADQEQVERLVALLREHDSEQRVLLTSFSYRCLKRVRRARYAGPLGFSQLDVVRLFFAPELLSRLLPFAGVRVQVPLRSGPCDLRSARFIERCHRLGLAIDYWVVNEPDTASELLAAGADGIITDDVRAIASAFQTSPRTGAWRTRHAHRCQP